MSNVNIVIMMMMFVIINQSTITLQKNLQKRHLQTIQFGSKYLKETIGISITNNHLYQFLFIDNMIEIIRYDYEKLNKINETTNNYKLNLVDGQMLVNGLVDLIPSNVAKQLMTILQWNGSSDEEEEESSMNHDNKTMDNQHSTANNNNEPPPIIISMSMSIDKNGKIRIYCLKLLDQTKYYIGDYNQEIDMKNVKIFFGSHEENKHIMGTISYQNKGLITLVYSKLSFYLQMMKLKRKNYGDKNFEWTKSIVVDSSLNFLYQFDEKSNEQQQQQELTKSFSKIFGQHTLTYGFVDDNQMFLFSNPDEKLITFSMNIFENNYRKYQFQLQSYRDFFHDYNTFFPDNIDDNKHISTIKFILSISAILIFVSILIGLIVYYCKRKKFAEKILKKLPLQFEKKNNLPNKQPINLDGKSLLFNDSSKTKTTGTTTTMLKMIGKLSSDSLTTSTSTITEKSVSDSIASKTPTTTTIKMSGKLLSVSSILKTPPTTTSKVSGKSLPVSSISKTPKITKVSGKSLPVSSISKTPTTTTTKMTKI